MPAWSVWVFARSPCSARTAADPFSESVRGAESRAGTVARRLAARGARAVRGAGASVATSARAAGAVVWPFAESPLWRLAIAAINSPLRIRPVPLMPRVDASACNSGSTIALRPPLDPAGRRLVRVPPLSPLPPVAAPATLVERASWGASVISVTQDPSERNCQTSGSCHARGLAGAHEAVRTGERSETAGKHCGNDHGLAPPRWPRVWEPIRRTKGPTKDPNQKLGCRSKNIWEKSRGGATSALPAHSREQAP